MYVQIIFNKLDIIIISVHCTNFIFSIKGIDHGTTLVDAVNCKSVMVK